MIGFELTARRHTGTERYGVRFELKGQGDLYDTQGQDRLFVFRPTFVYLGWERDLGGIWVRRTLASRNGSRVEGPRVLKGGKLSATQAGVREVFKDRKVGGALTKYVASTPGLLALITQEEGHLPT